MPLDPSHDVVGTIIFDFDGTLVDSAPAMTRALNEMASRRALPPIDVAHVRNWVSLGGDAMLRGALGHRDDPQADLEELRGILRGQTADPADLYPGVAETLAVLKRQGYRMGICTNKREDIAITYAEGLGISEYFDAIVGGAPSRPLKPNPRMATMALDRLASTADDTVFVGDSEVDASTALAIGLRFVLVTFGYPSGDVSAIKADSQIDTFGELPDLIREMSTGTCTRRTTDTGQTGR